MKETGRYGNGRRGCDSSALMLTESGPEFLYDSKLIKPCLLLIVCCLLSERLV